MDPRNFLDENHIYMFEQLAYDSSSQTQAGVEAILQGSFMYKNNIGTLIRPESIRQLILCIQNRL